MEIGVKRLSYSFYRLYSEFFKLAGELFVYHLHSVDKRLIRSFRNTFKPSFEVVYNRQDLLDHVLRSHIVHLGFLFVGTLSEVFKLSHLALYPVFKIRYFFISRIFLFFFIFLTVMLFLIILAGIVFGFVVGVFDALIFIRFTFRFGLVLF